MHKNIILALIFIASAIFAVNLILPKKTLAEIATAQDWWGLFIAGDTTGGPLSAYYTGNSDLGLDCQAKPPATHSNRPWLGSSTGPTNSPTKCIFTMPSNPGAYEFRLYANNSDTLLALSKIVWVGFTLNEPVSVCTTPPYVTLSWPALMGVTAIDINRDGVAINSIGGTLTSYMDNTVVANRSYNYSITTHSGTRGSITTPERSIDVCPVPVPPAWLQTSGGDVHSNQ